MGHILGPNSHVSIATLARRLLPMGIETWDRECGPFQRNFALFGISGQVGNTIGPCSKGPSQKKTVILVAYEQGSMALGFCLCSSGLAGVMQLTVRATLPNFPSLAVFCPVV